MTIKVQEKIEPTLNLKSAEPVVCEEYVLRLNKPGLGLTTLDAIDVGGQKFYIIDKEYWQHGYFGSDHLGIFAVFHRIKGEFKGHPQ